MGTIGNYLRMAPSQYYLLFKYQPRRKLLQLNLITSSFLKLKFEANPSRFQHWNLINSKFRNSWWWKKRSWFDNGTFVKSLFDRNFGPNFYLYLFCWLHSILQILLLNMLNAERLNKINIPVFKKKESFSFLRLYWYRSIEKTKRNASYTSPS